MLFIVPFQVAMAHPLHALAFLVFFSIFLRIFCGTELRKVQRGTVLRNEVVPAVSWPGAVSLASIIGYASTLSALSLA